MNDDDEPKQLGGALGALVREDLYDFSVADLEARIASLRAEIARAENALASRGGARDAADALFKD